MRFLSSLVALSMGALLGLLSPATTQLASAQGLVMSSDSVDLIPNQYIALFKQDQYAYSISTFTQLFTDYVNNLNLGTVSELSTTSGLKGLTFHIDNALQETMILSYLRSLYFVECINQDRYHLIHQGQRERRSPLHKMMKLMDADSSSSSSDASAEEETPVAIATGESVPFAFPRINLDASNSLPASPEFNLAILDTGVDYSHPDLAGRAVHAINCVDRSSSSSQDDNSHGTEVAGVLGALNQGEGLVGAFPSNASKIFVIKVADSEGYASLSSQLCGLDWLIHHAVNNSIKIASMSIGGVGSNDNNCGYSNCDPLHRSICALQELGVSFVTSAGNAETSLDTFVPAAYPEVLTATSFVDTDGLPGGLGPVACTGDSDDSFPTYSNFAASSTAAAHTVSAPSTCINSTALGGGYTTVSGTSFAAPLAAAALAVCFQEGGACYGQTPADAIATLVAQNQAYNAATNGYAPSSNNASSSVYYGPLLHFD